MPEGIVDGQKPAAEGEKPIVDGQKPAVDGKPTEQQNQRPNPDTKPGNKDGEPSAKEKGLLTEVQKERAARQKLERQVAELTGTLTAEQKRVKALAGLETKPEAELESDEIRAKLLAVMPELGDLTAKEFGTALKKLVEMLPAMERTQQHYWGKQGLNSLNAIEKKIGETFGDLSPRQVKAIRSAYVLEAENNPEFARRHEDDAEALIEEFSKNWIEDWFEPAKRKITADEVARLRKVPGARDRTLVTGQGEKPIDVTDDKAVGDMLVAGFRNKGGEFGRR